LIEKVFQNKRLLAEGYLKISGDEQREDNRYQDRVILSSGILRSVERWLDDSSHSASRGGAGGAFFRLEIWVSRRRFAPGEEGVRSSQRFSV
jgi:hypothetical protein